MKKLIAYLIIFLLMASPTWSYAATYYAQGAGNIDAVQWDTTAGGGGTDLVWANLDPADILYANGNAITINVSFTCAKISTAAGAGTAGGSFAVATSVTPLTITAAREAGTTDCLAVTGNANANPALTLVGADTGSTTTAGKCGTYDAHTVGTVVVTSGAAQGNLGQGYLSNSSTGTVSFTGTCTGSSTGVGAGCQASGVAALTLIGNSIAGTRASGHFGSIIWGGAATNYVQLKTAASTANLYADIPDAANVTEDDTVAGVTGTYHEASEAEVQSGVTFGAASGLTGTYSGGGGGAWAN